MSGSIEKERQKPRVDAKHDGKQRREKPMPMSSTKEKQRQGKAALQRNNTIEQERKGCLWRIV